ncbi:uncharacterized protein LTR77_005801 [Saxophila tyrrhenica]|uniref:Uncharacterized protein n=1 Tax=Saxophila tyrrhenica TaxID=1690608 RepID=A0AAV9P9K4_9PEZI|nr:hypothetical protein LTR77_005801 [Saxophila tyrrhenica]
MILPHKRKAAIKAGEYEDTANDEKVVKKARRAGSRKKGSKATKKCPLMELPGELRNRIYEEALRDEGGPKTSDDTAMLIGPRSGPEWPLLRRLAGKANKGGREMPRTRPKWREPSLLMASKQIRQEAIGIYLEVNRFKAYISKGVIAGAVQWMMRYHKLCGARMFEQVDVESYALSWKDWEQDTGELFSFAKLIFVLPVDCDSQAAECALWNKFLDTDH